MKQMVTGPDGNPKAEFTGNQPHDADTGSYITQLTFHCNLKQLDFTWSKLLHNESSPPRSVHSQWQMSQ